MAIWHGKKDSQEPVPDDEIPDVLAHVEGGESGGLHQLIDRLGGLRRVLDQTAEQVLAYLIHQESQSHAGTMDADAAAALSEKLAALAEKLDQVDAKLKSASGQGGAEAAEDVVSATLIQIRDGVNRQFAALAEGVQQLQQRLDAGLQRLTEQLRPQEPEQPNTTGPSFGSDWQAALLGSELAEYPGLDFQRQQLLDGVLRGNADACALVGQLLVFRSAMTDKMPPLLKDIGEAYYRWQPKTHPGSNPMEEALVAWLGETMQDAGISNRIELVDPGQRFDSTRHNAPAPGVEITEVRGWIVLRDNGRVYTKAGVVVK